MARLWQRYNQLLVERPLITKGLTGGTLFSIGDFMAQYLDGTLQSPEGYNAKRTAIGFCWSSLIFTPHGHAWYAKLLPRLFPTPHFKHSASKMILDQTIFATYINAFYLGYSTLAHGGNIDDAKNKIEKDLWTLLKANYYLWPAVQLATFSFIPIPLQMPVMNVAVMFWSCYVAIVANRERVAAMKAGVVPPTRPDSIAETQNHILASVNETYDYTTTRQFAPTCCSPSSSFLLLPTSSQRILASMYDNNGSSFPRRVFQHLGAISSSSHPSAKSPFTNQSSTPSQSPTPSPSFLPNQSPDITPLPSESTPPNAPNGLQWLRNLETKLKALLPESLIEPTNNNNNNNDNNDPIEVTIERLYQPSTTQTSDSLNDQTQPQNEDNSNSSFLSTLSIPPIPQSILYSPLLGLYNSIAFITTTYDNYHETKRLKLQKDEELLRATVIILDALEGIFTDDTIAILDSLEYTKFLELDQIRFLNHAKSEYLAQKAQEKRDGEAQHQREYQEKLILNQLSDIGVKNLDSDENRLQLYQKYPFLLSNLSSNPFQSQPSVSSPSRNASPNLTHLPDQDYLEYSGNHSTHSNKKSFELVNPNKLSPVLLSTMNDDELISVLFDNDIPKNLNTIPAPTSTKSNNTPQFMTLEEIAALEAEVSSTAPPPPPRRRIEQHDHDDYDERGNPVSPAVQFGFTRDERETDDIVKSFFESYSPPPEAISDGIIMISLDDDDMKVMRKNKDKNQKPWATDRDLPTLDDADSDDDEFAWDDDDESDMLELYIDYNKEIQLAKKIKSQQKAQKLQQLESKSQTANNNNNNRNHGIAKSKVYGDNDNFKYQGYQDEDGMVYDMTFFDDVDDDDEFILHAHQPSSTKRKNKNNTDQKQTSRGQHQTTAPIDANELIKTGIQFSQAYSTNLPKTRPSQDIDSLFSRHNDDNPSENTNTNDDTFQREILRERALNKRLFKP